MKTVHKTIRRTVTILLSASIMMSSLSVLTSCRAKTVAYSDQFMGSFDTVISIVAHQDSKVKFDEIYNYSKTRFEELHKLYDIYNLYPGVINAKTINDNAGKRPVKIQKELVDLLTLSIEWNKKSSGKFNIAFGSVLKIWHDYREMADPEDANAQIPTLQELQAANKHVSINDLVIDTAKSEVFIKDPKMQIDLGAVAKGYATELVANELKAKGYTNFAISAGGNVEVVGYPAARDDKNWTIGIQDPQKPTNTDPNDGLINKVRVIDTSVVTSGWYQRYYKSQGKIYHHIIDPGTLFPQDYFQAVTVVYPNSGICDILSTILMILPPDESYAFIKTIPGAKAFWILSDGTIKVSEGMNDLLIDKIK